METRKRKSSSTGFSLIELLVVIAIIALLIAVVLPGLKVAQERARRVVCLSNIHQFILGIQVYADQNACRLPASGTKSTFELLTPDYNVLADNIGSDKAMFCPSLGKPFIRKSSGRF